MVEPWSAGGPFLVATGALHLLYTETLFRGYTAGDLTVEYRLARGTGRLLSFCGAVAWLHERPSVLAASGALLITFGILHCSAGWPLSGILVARRVVLGHHDRLRNRGLYAGRWLLGQGAYAFAHPGGVCRQLVSGCGSVFGAHRRRASLRQEYAQCWQEALGIALLAPFGYILVLFAMRSAPVSHVAPMREMSMMLGMYFGARYLSEGQIARRLVGSALMSAGSRHWRWDEGNL